MDALRDFWESIPMWVVIAVVAILLVGAYFLFQYLHQPTWLFWVLLGGIGLAVVVGLVKGALGGGM